MIHRVAIAFHWITAILSGLIIGENDKTMKRKPEYGNTRTSGPIFLAFFMLIGLLQGNYVYSQPFVPENIYVHFDRSFYLAGETIHFKIYFLNPAPVISRIVHIDLQDAEGSYVFNSIYQVKDNMAAGAFIIPYDLKEANYLFRCYTRWNLNFDGSYIYTRLIPIYNDFNENPSLLSEDQQDMINLDSVQMPYTFSSGVSIKINTAKALRTNHEIELVLFTTDKNNHPVPASLSMGVLSSLLTDQTKHLNISVIENEAESRVNPVHKISFEPEDSIEIRGMAYDPETGAPINSRVLSVYNVRESQFRRLISSKGTFHIKMPVFEGHTDFQIINMNPFQPKIPDIQWIPLHEELPEPDSFRPLPDRDSGIERYIFYTRLRRKIREIFYETTHDSIQLQKPPVLPFIPDRSYDLNQYQLIRNTFDFFREAVSNTNFYKKDGEVKMRLFNSETMEFFMTSPWFIVDGHFFFNDSLVHNIPFNQLSRIDIYNRKESILKYFEPIMIQGGIVAIYTKNNSLIDYIRKMPNTFRIAGIAPQATPEDEIPSGQHNSYETPDFSPVIHWDPHIQTDEQGKATVKFQTNDVTGKIVIQVEGMDRNGMPIAGQLIIEIRP
jgi:hypothetical protein